jgi:hypothetical protein
MNKGNAKTLFDLNSNLMLIKSKINGKETYISLAEYKTELSSILNMIDSDKTQGFLKLQALLGKKDDDKPDSFYCKVKTELDNKTDYQKVTWNDKPALQEARIQKAQEMVSGGLKAALRSDAIRAPNKTAIRTIAEFLLPNIFKTILGNWGCSKKPVVEQLEQMKQTLAPRVQ